MGKTYHRSHMSHEWIFPTHEPQSTDQLRYQHFPLCISRVLYMISFGDADCWSKCVPFKGMFELLDLELQISNFSFVSPEVTGLVMW